MKRILLWVPVIGLFYTFSACNQAREGKDYAEQNAITADSTAAMISSSAATSNHDSARKFIRTAELKFKVKDVARTTYQIEDITGRYGGFVTFTNLASNVNYTNSVAVSPDSSLESTYYTVENTMTLRVPNTKLDSTLKAIAGLVDYLDYRIIKADDVSLQLLSNQLANKRLTKSENRLTNAIDNRGKKLNETSQAEETRLDKEEQADNVKLSNLALMDQVQFSTVSLSIYQRQAVIHELVSNDKNITAYEPSFGRKLLTALGEGWQILAAFLLFIARMWGLIVFGIIIFILIRQLRIRLRLSKAGGGDGTGIS